VPGRHFKLTYNINAHDLPARIKWEYNHCEEGVTKPVTRPLLSIAVIVRIKGSEAGPLRVRH